MNKNYIINLFIVYIVSDLKLLSIPPLNMAKNRQNLSIPAKNSLKYAKNSGQTACGLPR
jgi:hypothetical protein